uniref:Uncharacterized protein n=1 Tax=Anguilla anguilla TaxID=7936 RepID=A0A0E9VLD3_ANGAN
MTYFSCLQTLQL